MRAALILIGVALGALAGVTAVGAALDGEPARPPSAPPYHGLGAERGTDSVEGRAADPSGKGPDWAVVVYRSKDGRICAAAGRNVGGKVGALNAGRFSEYPIDEGGSCVDLDAVPAGAQVTTRVGDDEVTVVHGIAGPSVADIVVRWPSGTQEPEIGPRGGFVATLPSGVGLDDVDVIAHLENGGAAELL